MENKLMYVVRSQYDQFTHRVSDLVSLLDLLVGLSGREK